MYQVLNSVGKMSSATSCGKALCWILLRAITNKLFSHWIWKGSSALRNYSASARRGLLNDANSKLFSHGLGCLISVGWEAGAVKWLPCAWGIRHVREALSCLLGSSSIWVHRRGKEVARLSEKCLTRQPLHMVWVMCSAMCSPSSYCFTAGNKCSYLEKTKTGFNCISD